MEDLSNKICRDLKEKNMVRALEEIDKVYYIYDLLILIQIVYFFLKNSLKKLNILFYFSYYETKLNSLYKIIHLLH